MFFFLDQFFNMDSFCHCCCQNELLHSAWNFTDSRHISDFQNANLCWSTNSCWDSQEAASVPFKLLCTSSAASFSPVAGSALPEGCQGEAVLGLEFEHKHGQSLVETELFCPHFKKVYFQLPWRKELSQYQDLLFWNFLAMTFFENYLVLTQKVL